MKLRIAAAAVVGVVLVGVVCWPWQSPPDPFGSLVLKEIGANGAVTLLVMAFLAGLFSYFASWPYGREIGILAAPFGLCLWSVRAGSMGALIQLNPTLTQRSEILAAMKWEPLFWLLVVACGFAGVAAGQRIVSRFRNQQSQEKTDLKPVNFLYLIISVLLSAVVVVFFLKMFARDVGVQNNEIEIVSVQPALWQNIFAILMSFGIAAFLVKLFLNLSYVWSIISCVPVTIYAVNSYMNSGVLESFVENYPAAFFPNVIVSILPVQMVTFGAIGSIIGYWMAIRYDYWRKHEL
ncbi:MAG: hypothetical protein JXA96_03585 [Sedimentisphaerales bacterium]|nr:hypothetical protein [Sedimentisphaerales bacterium]